MSNEYTDTDSENLAISYFDVLTEGTGINLPSIDFSDPQYNIGDSGDSPFYRDVEAVTVDDLTEANINGLGVFDTLMRAYAAHLSNEYNAGRISGPEYTKAYVGVMQNAMGQAMQFLLAKDQSYWQSLLVQAQGRTAEVAAINARVQLETTKAGYGIAAAQLDQGKAQYALTKLQLASEDARYDLLKTQDQIEEARLTSLIPLEIAGMGLRNDGQTIANEIAEVQRDTGQYELTNQKPVEVANLTKQGDVLTQQVARSAKEVEQITYTVEHMLPAQKAKLEGEVVYQTQLGEKITYEVANIMPAQLAGMEADTANKIAQKAGIEADTLLTSTQNSKASFEVTSMMPAQLLGIVADNDNKAAQNLNIVANTSLTDVQADKVIYETSNILPTQKASMEQDMLVKVAQIGQIEADTLLRGAQLVATNYDTDELKPAQKNLTLAQTDQVTEQTNKVSAERDQVIYQTTFTLPSQKLNIEADTNIKTYQANEVLPAQAANTTADTLLKTYQKDNLLPSQKRLTDEQAEAKRAETLNVRSDGATVLGSIGKQKDLYDQQITSYQRDAEVKAAKMWMDNWISHQTIFESDDTPTALGKASLNDVMSAIKTKNNL